LDYTDEHFLSETEKQLKMRIKIKKTKMGIDKHKQQKRRKE